MMRPVIGSQLGNYRLISPLGSGGFADVYLGMQIYLETKAAIKVLHVGSGLNDEDLQHFLREARIIAQLRHPNIVSVLDFGVERDLPYLVMEYAPHGSLWRKHSRGSVISLPTVVSYVRQVAAALQYAHEHRVVHCDVKPENMLLSEDDSILLGDFGIARVVQNTVHTQTGAVAGTISYMAPEQFVGKSIPASDQYALGIVVYQWLCGRLPFDGANVAEMFFMHTYSELSSLQEQITGLPPAVEQVVFRALAKDPQKRFSNVRDFATALENAAKPTTIRDASTSSVAPVSYPTLTGKPPSIDNASTGYDGGTVRDVSNDLNDAVPLLSSVLKHVPIIDDSLGGPVKADGPSLLSPQATMLEGLVSATNSVVPSAEQQGSVSAENFASIPLLPQPSTLLPALETTQEDVHQEGGTTIPVSSSNVTPPEDVSASLLLPSISFILPREKVSEDAISTILITPSSSSETVIATSAASSEAATAPDSPLGPEETDHYTFFISYDRADQDWARWIARHMEKAGYSIAPYMGTAQSGLNVVVEMQEALRKAEYVITLITPSYLQSRSNQTDWTTLFRKNLTDEQRKVLPVCVRACEQSFEQLLNTSVYINLIGLDAGPTLKKLLEGVQRWVEPFPGGETIIVTEPDTNSKTSASRSSAQQIEIFISYSHKDRRHWDELNKHLVPIKKNYQTAIWYDKEIRPGVNFAKEIESHLLSARIILLLVSPDFIASDYCREKELGPAMERHHRGDAYVIPVILKDCMWSDDNTPFGMLKALPVDGKAIERWKPRNVGYRSVAEGVKQVIKDLLKP